MNPDADKFFRPRIVVGTGNIPQMQDVDVGGGPPSFNVPAITASVATTGLVVSIHSISLSSVDLASIVPTQTDNTTSP